jgi:hypothetical protein
MWGGKMAEMLDSMFSCLTRRWTSPRIVLGGSGMEIYCHQCAEPRGRWRK